MRGVMRSSRRKPKRKSDRLLIPKKISVICQSKPSLSYESDKENTTITTKSEESLKLKVKK
jgi:hypothetical protein